MKQNTLRRIILFCFAVAISLSSSLYAQVTADVGVSGAYNPTAFTKFSATPVTGTSANGTFDISLSKVGGDIPANNFSIVIALAPDVAYSGEPVTLPAGFTFEVISPYSLRIKQTGVYAGSSSSANIVFNIPVQAKAAVDPSGPSNWAVQIQQDDLGYEDSNSSNGSSDGRVSVADSPLPVTLISFNVKGEGATANLVWKTTEEINSDYFEIQHSMDAKNWIVIKKVESHKDSKVLNTYTDTHNNPQSGINYYRLKMVDKDLSFAYSGMKSIKFDNVGSEFYVYPNPVTEYVRFNNYESIKEATILNQLGAAVLSSKKVTADGLQVNNLSNGLYMLQIKSTDGNTSVRKFIIRR